MTGWDALARELDGWLAAGRAAALWWRDDDAARPSPALDRLLALAGDRALPIALAVVPAAAEPGLAERLAGQRGLAVLQHGYAHRNHAPAGEKKAELGPHRPLACCLAELAEGRRRLESLFGASGDGLLPVLVPPWNRIDPALVARLGSLGFAGLSTYGPEPEPPPEGLAIVNAHVDPIDWRGGRGFLGEAPTLALLVAALGRARRRPRPGLAVGLLTHHLEIDAAGWRFLERLLAALAPHPALRWPPPAALFRPAEVPSVA